MVFQYSISNDGKQALPSSLIVYKIRILRYTYANIQVYTGVYANIEIQIIKLYFIYQTY